MSMRWNRGKPPAERTASQPRNAMPRHATTALARLVAAVALMVSGAWLAVEAVIVALPMPDLARAQKVSTVVLADDHRILKAFLSPDGMWRLPTTVRDVPSQYLAMLLAYEDRRFFQHGGVDVLAVARAAWQFVHHGGIVSGA